MIKLYHGMKGRLGGLAGRRGNLIVTEDTGELYADVSAARLKIGYSTDEMDFQLSGKADASELNALYAQIAELKSRLAENTYAVEKIEEYKTAGTYVFTVPEGVRHIGAFIMGPGGPGGSTNVGKDGAAQSMGGGAGYVSILKRLEVTEGQEFNVVVGAPSSTGQGGASSFAGVSAAGGTTGGIGFFTKLTADAYSVTDRNLKPGMGSSNSDTPGGCINPFEPEKKFGGGGCSYSGMTITSDIGKSGNSGGSGTGGAATGNGHGGGGGQNLDYAKFTGGIGAPGIVIIYAYII